MKNQADVTVQNVVAHAIANLNGISSCSSIERSYIELSNLATMSDIRFSILADYRLYSKAKMNITGFFDIPAADWLCMSKAEKEAIRLERLYYFWMANQDNMDAFS